MMDATSTSEQAQAWDAAAAGWDAHGALVRRWLAPATAQMLALARLQPGARVLDVAAGAGDQTLDIARAVAPGGQVLATDVSPAILARARVRVAAAGCSGVTFAVADAQALGLDGQGFDAALCRLGLMFCPQPLQALHAMHAALRPGGRLAGLVFSHAGVNPCITTAQRIARQHVGLGPADPHAPGTLLSLGPPGRLEALLAQAGFAEVQVGAVAAPLRTARCEDYVAFVREAGSPLRQLLGTLPAAAQARAWDDIVQALQVHRQADGWEGPNELLLFGASRALST
jgi:SAM-dependent methyltransferase